MRAILITQISDDDPVFAEAFREATNIDGLDRLDIAVAYATMSGIPCLADAIGRDMPVSRWVIGIDDAVSQPTAIEQIQGMPGAEVRLASKGPRYRFHPKIYQLWSSTNPEACVSYVGSSNFTANGLQRNAEAGVVLISESIEEAEAMREQWQSFWNLGHPLTPLSLERYREAYDAVRVVRAAADRTVREEVLDDASIVHILDAVPDNLAFDGTPQTATVAWLECGTASAGGRDLEFPAPMVPFFHLQGYRQIYALRMLPGNAVFELSFTMRQDNGMWRVLLSSDAIEVATGRTSLRPIAGGNRSDLAIIFRRIHEAEVDFDVQFFEIGSAEYDELVRDTQAHGVISRTRGPGGRNFGYL